MQTMNFNVGSDRRGLVADVQNFKIGNDAKNWVQARQFEGEMRTVVVNVMEGTIPLNLTGTTIWFEGLMSDGKTRIIDAKHGTILSPSTGQFRFEFPYAAFATFGSYKQSFFKIMRDGKSIATLEFTLDVLVNLVEDGIVPLDYITPFQDLYAKLEVIYHNADSNIKEKVIGWQQQVTELITSLNGDYTSIQTAVNGLRTSLDVLEEKIKGDGLLTQAELDKSLLAFNDKFNELANETAKALGDFQNDNSLVGFADDMFNEVGGAIPSYYQNKLRQMTSIRSDTFNFGFITDNHMQIDGYAPNSLAHYANIAGAARYANLKAIIAGGDNTNGWWDRNQKIVETRQVTSTLFNRAPSGTDVFFQLGNHDTGINQNGNNTPDTTLSIDEIKTLYRTDDLLFNEIRDGDSLYGYKDYDDNKVRLIWLNSFDLPTTLNADGTFKYDLLNQPSYQNKQLNWLVNTALKLKDNTWQVIITTHAPLPKTFGDIPVEFNSDVLIGILTAFKKGQSYSFNDSTRDMPVNISCDFSTQGTGILVALISGHIHEDGQMLYEGINCIETAASLCYSGDSKRQANTETEDCWDIFSIDTKNRKIHTYRFGYGVDRDFIY